MAKGYWIARVDVHDADRYARYLAENGAAFAKFGARFVVRAGRFDAVEGTARGRNVVLEFPSYDDAVACYHSPEYAAAKEHRLAASEGEVIIIEGHADAPAGS